jgi:hypothetical protein
MNVCWQHYRVTFKTAEVGPYHFALLIYHLFFVPLLSNLQKIDVCCIMFLLAIHLCNFSLNKWKTTHHTYIVHTPYVKYATIIKVQNIICLLYLLFCRYTNSNDITLVVVPGIVNISTNQHWLYQSRPYSGFGK